MTSQAQRDMARLTYLSSEIDALYHEAAVALGVSDSIMLVLYTLQSGGGSSTLGDIIRQTGISKQTLNSALRKLEEQGMICGQELPRGRRQISLTAAGERLAAETAQQVIDMENRIFDGWSVQDRAAYLSLTQRYLRELKQQVKAIKDKKTHENSTF